jgi:hypothetical protein
MSAETHVTAVEFCEDDSLRISFGQISVTLDYETAQQVALYARVLRDVREERTDDVVEIRVPELNGMITRAAEHTHACNCQFGPQDPRCCIAKAQRRVVEDAHRFGRQGIPLPEKPGPLLGQYGWPKVPSRD